MNASPSERPTWEGVCPVCGDPMRRAGEEMRCERWPACRGKRGLPLDQRLHAAGVKGLFDDLDERP